MGEGPSIRHRLKEDMKEKRMGRKKREKTRRDKDRGEARSSEFETLC